MWVIYQHHRSAVDGYMDYFGNLSSEGSAGESK